MGVLGIGGLFFRAKDPEALAIWYRDLRDEGIEVETRDEWNDPSVGSFARIKDPEGNPVELWETAS